MGKKENGTRRKKPKTKSEGLAHARPGQITRTGLITRAGLMIIRPKVSRKEVDIEYLQVPAAAQEGSSLRAAEDNISKAKSKSDHKNKTAKTTQKTQI